MNTGPASPDQAILKLRKDWDQLSDPDRATALAQIKKSGLSIRKIARELAHSEASLRRLLSLLHAPAADLAAIRNGKISTNEVLRRVEVRRQQKTAEQRANTERERRRQGRNGAKLISDWLQQHGMAGSYGEQVVEEARRIIIQAHFEGAIPHVTPPDHPISPDVIIERCKPKEPLDDYIHPSGWYSKWLARWIVFAFPDPDARDRALEIASEQQHRM